MSVTFTEGGSHEHCTMHERLIATLPRHREISEGTARNILKSVRKAAGE